MRANHVQRAIREGQPTIGTWLSLASVLAAERMARAGAGDQGRVTTQPGVGDGQASVVANLVDRPRGHLNRSTTQRSGTSLRR